MRVRINWSYVMAIAIAGGVAWWMSQGDIIRGGRADTTNSEPPPAERNAQADEERFAVRVRTFGARDRVDALSVRGRTEADTNVSVRVETSAQIEEVLVQEGAHVKAGDVLCKLDLGARRARVLHAQARLAQARLEYDANSQLVQKGFASQTVVAAMKAELDAAQATLEEAEQEFDHAEVEAPVDGIVQSPIVEVGEVLEPGGVCATLIKPDPMLFVGQVSEREIGKLSIGDNATVATVTGQNVDGTIRYIANAADPETRTFRIEILMPNADQEIRDGLTALAEIPLPSTRAHLISPGVLVLDDAGRLGVRTLADGDKVKFMPVNILADTASEGVWIAGLPETVTLITVGQDYVVHGEHVRAVFETAGAAQ